MRAEIITIGTELLLGEIDDTNATWMAQQLRELGVDLLYRSTVGDNVTRIAEVVDQALDRVDIVITSGGLGPTVDDKTREGIARATGKELVFEQRLLDQIAEKFQRFGVEMSENNRRQAYIPDGATAVANPVGTAPVFTMETKRGIVITTPGVPREMKHLLKTTLLPWLSERVDTQAVIVSRILRTAGIGESQIDNKIDDLMQSSNPTVGLAAHTGQVDIRITAKAATEDIAKQMIGPVEKDIRRRLARWIYGTGSESIETVVADMLLDAKETLACVDVGTNNQLVERIKADGNRVLQGYFTGEDVKGLFTELGNTRLTSLEQAAITAAQQIRARYNSTYGLAIIMSSDEELDEQGVAIAAADDNITRSRVYEWLHNRPDAPIWAATQSLAMLRGMLLKKRN